MTRLVLFLEDRNKLRLAHYRLKASAKHATVGVFQWCAETLNGRHGHRLDKDQGFVPAAFFHDPPSDNGPMAKADDLFSRIVKRRLHRLPTGLGGN